MEHRFPPVLVLLICAAVAPMIAAATRRLGLSVVVIELLLGVALGPQGLAIVSATTGALPAFATLGLAFLFFIAGLEIDLPAIRGTPLRLAFAGWVCGLALAVAIAFGMRAAGLADAWLVVAIALMTTALGVLVPILRDGSALDTPFGRNVLASGVMGELGPILAISLIVSRRFSAGTQASLTLVFMAIVLLLVWLMTRGGRVPTVLGFLRRGFDHSGQTPIRVALVLVVGLAVLAEDFGLDLALGALAAGMMVGFATRGGARVHDLHAEDRRRRLRVPGPALLSVERDETRSAVGRQPGRWTRARRGVSCCAGCGAPAARRVIAPFVGRARCGRRRARFRRPRCHSSS